MNARHLFNQFMKETIAPIFSENKFFWKGLYFYCKKKGNFGLIHFQKSVKSTSDSVIFTVNVGAVSERVLKFYSKNLGDVEPRIEDCHWRERLGFLLDAKDRWWKLEDEESLKKIQSEFPQYINIMIQKLNTTIADEALRDMWLSGRSPGLTDIQRLMNLSVLLNDLGPKESLGPVLKELRELSNGKATAPMVNVFLQQLGGQGNG